MPSKSQVQQQAAGIAYDAKKQGKVGALPPVSPSQQMAQSMDLSDLREFAHTKRKGLPKRTKKKKA